MKLASLWHLLLLYRSIFKMQVKDYERNIKIALVLFLGLQTPIELWKQKVGNLS